MRMIRNALALMAVALPLSALLAVPAAAEVPAGSVAEFRLDGVVDPFMADYLKGGIEDANAAGAAAVLITIDTPGGLDSSMREITQAVLNSKVPVIGYVSPSGARAASAGTFILLATNIAAMAPGTNVGAAHPVGLSGAIASEKATNDAAAYIVSIAEARDRNAAWAASAVRDSVSISAQEALGLDVIDLIEPDVSSLLQAVDGTTVTVAGGQQVTLATAGAPVVQEEMGWFASFLHSLLNPNLAFIFFWLGLGLIVLELIVPGHIFSGTIGTLLLIIALVSFGVLPVRIIGIALLVLSVIAFVVELQAPGLGIWGAIGVIALLLGGWFLYDRSAGVQVSPGVLLGVAIFAGLFFGLVVAKAIQLRHVPPVETRKIVGADGVALATGVGPNGGQVRVAAEQWQAVAPGGPIPGGAPIRVMALDGLMLTVEPASTEHVSAGQQAPTEEGGTTA